MYLFISNFVLLQEGLNTSGEAEGDIPKYILDTLDKTTYLRGKFLGKVSAEDFFKLTFRISLNSVSVFIETWSIK